MLTKSIIEAVVEKVSTYQHPSIHFIQALRPLVKIKKLDRNDLLVEAGKRISKLWFIYKGFAREIGYDEDHERTSWFYFENDFVFAYPTFFSQLPAFRGVEIIHETYVAEINYSDLFVLRQEFPELVVIMDFARDHCELERARYASRMHTLSARERYERFFEEHKPIFNIAKHRDIASFLGIKNDGFNRYNH